ncbi:MAG TPA: alpha/beta fold hydrolase [Bacteriovoracaceae bacterium]|nr:alpha/beta fold hydrolase [Bacteriovoracaceae bacterium]HLW56339.1 alpha/beta fold hydrolase [Bacteriovoracaceae bacterium]
MLNKYRAYDEEILSTNGESLLFLRHYQKGSPRHHFLIVHGAIEHGGRLGELTSYLLEHWDNIKITTYDHLGHGRSGGARAFFKSMQILIDDMEMIALREYEKHPYTHHWIFAHSMGGLVALSSRFALNPHKELKGIILSNPCIRPLVKYEILLEKVVRKIEFLLPFFHLPTLYKGAHLTRDPIKANEFYTDPLISKFMTARMAREIYDWSKKIRRQAYYMRAPMLFLIGEEDQVVDPESTKLFASGIDKSLKTIIQYPQHYHDLCNELNREKIFEDVTVWMQEQL